MCPPGKKSVVIFLAATEGLPNIVVCSLDKLLTPLAFSTVYFKIEEKDGRRSCIVILVNYIVI